MFKKPRR